MRDFVFFAYGAFGIVMLVVFVRAIVEVAFAALDWLADHRGVAKVIGVVMMLLMGGIMGVAIGHIPRS